jgi:hypothetical protein
MKVDVGWIASVAAAIPALYLLVTTGYWPLTVIAAPSILLGLWVTRVPETSGDRHGVVQLACLLAIMTALGMQGALTLP